MGNPHTTAFLSRLVSPPFSVDSHLQLTGRCMAIPEISGLHVRARKKQTCHVFPNATFKLPESRTWLFLLRSMFTSDLPSSVQPTCLCQWVKGHLQRKGSGDFRCSNETLSHIQHWHPGMPSGQDNSKDLHTHTKKKNRKKNSVQGRTGLDRWSQCSKTHPSFYLIISLTFTWIFLEWHWGGEGWYLKEIVRSSKQSWYLVVT